MKIKGLLIVVLLSCGLYAEYDTTESIGSQKQNYNKVLYNSIENLKTHSASLGDSGVSRGEDSGVTTTAIQYRTQVKNVSVNTSNTVNTAIRNMPSITSHTATFSGSIVARSVGWN